MTPDVPHPPIGITGRKRAGKDSLAALLKFDLCGRGYAVRTRSFADPLREVLLATDPIIGPSGAYTPAEAWHLSELFALGNTWETLKGHKHFGPEIRRLLQNLGTEGIRAIDPDFWVNAARADVLAHPNHRTILPDVRFPNEAAMITDLGGFIIRVDRPGLPDDDPHTSEDLSWADAPGVVAFHVTNDGSFRELHDAVRHIPLYPRS